MEEPTGRSSAAPRKGIRRFWNSNCMGKLLLWGKRLPPLDPPTLPTDPDWQQCDPAFIRRALNEALERPSGGWYVVDATRSLTDKPRLFQIDGKELVAYRIDGTPVVAQHACPHLGGPLSRGRICDGKLVCPWHGLRLPSPDHGHWQPLKTHDDGVLTWIHLGSEKEATPVPILPVRPKFFIDSVIRRDANCEASGILANRMDPWHGAHYHPHTFARLKVTEVTLDLLRVRVAFRVWGRFCIEVDATFHSPEPAITSKYFQNTRLSPGQQSCALKHLQALRLIVERNWQRALVLEDDAILASRFVQGLQAALEESAPL